VLVGEEDAVVVAAVAAVERHSRTSLADAVVAAVEVLHNPLVRAREMADGLTAGIPSAFESEAEVD